MWKHDEPTFGRHFIENQNSTTKVPNYGDASDFIVKPTEGFAEFRACKTTEPPTASHQKKCEKKRPCYNNCSW